MSVRMNYIFMPIDYVRELNSLGKRKKASAFMEYFNDMDTNDTYTIRFYAKSWGVSHTTAKRWIMDFQQVRDNSIAYLKLKEPNKEDIGNEC